MELKLILQIVGVILGLLYLWLEYRANIYLWLVSIVMPMVHGVLYYQSGLYADMAMDIYYMLAAVYGWWVWRYGAARRKEGREIPIVKTPGRMYLPLVVICGAVYALLAWVLIRFTDSTVPYVDAFTTALSVIGTWMLAHKYVEQWLVWVVVDVVTVGLYFYKDLPLTAGLYAVYSVIAVFGYFRWLRMMKEQHGTIAITD